MSRGSLAPPTPVERAGWTVAFLWHLRREIGLPWWPPGRLRRFQDRRARRMVHHAYRTVPFYRQAMDGLGLAPRDLRTAADLARLPLVGGEELAADPAAFRSSAVTAGHTLEISTTGTCGLHKTVELDRGALVAAYAAGWRRHRVIGRLVGRSTGYRTLGFSPPGGTTPTLRAAWAALVWLPRRADLSRHPRSIAEPPEDAVAAINAVRPATVGGFGSHLGMLFRWARDNGRALAAPKVVLYGGDTMSPADRALIEEDFGIPVVAGYQACEALRIGFQCERREGYHLFLDQVHVRLVDEAGREVGPGERGEVVISNLVNRATVLLNYRLGDLATLAVAACPCGRTLPTLESLAGRCDDHLLRPDGRPVHESLVLRRLYEVPGLVRLQVVQGGDTRRVTVNVVPAATACWPDLRDGLAAGVRELLGAADAEVVVRRVRSIPTGPGGKIRFVRRLGPGSAPPEADRPGCESRFP